MTERLASPPAAAWLSQLAEVSKLANASPALKKTEDFFLIYLLYVGLPK